MGILRWCPVLHCCHSSVTIATHKLLLQVQGDVASSVQPEGAYIARAGARERRRRVLEEQNKDTHGICCSARMAANHWSVRVRVTGRP